MKSAVANQIRQFDQFDASLLRIFGSHVWIKGDHLHAQGNGSLGYFLSDATKTDGSQYLVTHLDAHVLAALPVAGAHVRAGGRNVTRQ